MITTVSNTNQLWTALKAAHAGDTVLLAPGSYSAVALSGFNFNGNVTVQSADFSHQAVVNGITMNNSSGLTFAHIEIATKGATGATIAASHAITFDAINVHGAASGDGNGMMIRDSSGVTVTNSDFGKLATGINELNSQNLTISKNVFHEIQGEAIRGTGDKHEVISGNHFNDARLAIADHHDVINLWQDNTANDVVVSGNVFGPSPVLSSVTHPESPQPPPTVLPVVTVPPVIVPPVAAPPVAQPPVATPPVTIPAGPGATGHGTVTTVTTSDGLTSALKTAHAGDTINLAAGNYGAVNLANLHFSGGEVTIQSASNSSEAKLSGLTVNASSGLAFKHLDVAITGNVNGITLGNDTDISFSNIKVHGSADEDVGVGLFIRKSSGVSITDSEFTKLGSGIGHLDSSEITISDNSFHDLNTDGIYGGGSSHVVVSGNQFADFHPSVGVHPDAIQFFAGSGGVKGHDIAVQDNVITRGSGDPIQGIFIENTHDITITGNALTGTMYNGIALSGSSNAMIANNYVQGFLDMGTRIIVRGQSSDVSVVHNTTQSVVNYVDGGVANPNFVSTDNTIIAGTASNVLSGVNLWLTQHSSNTFAGTSGNDLLAGGAGDDTLVGGGGADTMVAGYGNDIYVVGDARAVVTEQANGGVDTIKTTLSTYTLPSQVENIELTGTSAQSAFGNALSNVMTTNGVSSVLSGGAGNDTLVVNGGAATLTGGAGLDTFELTRVPTSVVQITDFKHGEDSLDLHELLKAYHGTNPVADHYVQFQSDASGTTVLVDIDGTAGSSGFVAVAKLVGVTTVAAGDWIFS